MPCRSPYSVGGAYALDRAGHRVECPERIDVLIQPHEPTVGVVERRGEAHAAGHVRNLDRAAHGSGYVCDLG
jgi:hypothetical protein